jgi:hypothetical protein
VHTQRFVQHTVVAVVTCYEPDAREHAATAIPLALQNTFDACRIARRLRTPRNLRVRTIASFQLMRPGQEKNLEQSEREVIEGEIARHCCTERLTWGGQPQAIIGNYGVAGRSSQPRHTKIPAEEVSLVP